VLLSGNIPYDAVPDMRDEDVRREIKERLGQVGCELIYSVSGNCWIARSSGPAPDVEGLDSSVALDAKDLAVLALCWLHLRFLPAENSSGQTVLDDGALFSDLSTAPEVPLIRTDIRSQLPALSRQSIGIAVGRLKNARFLVEREEQLFAGPMMDALDEVRATEQARRMLLRHERLRRVRGAKAANDKTGSHRPESEGISDGTD
jgi:hypothetical protein